MSEVSRPHASPSLAVGNSGDRLAVPQDAATRSAIRHAARDVAALACRCKPLDRPRLESLAAGLLSRLGLDAGFLGFAMVAIGTEFYRDRFAAVPFSRRLLLLPHCLRKRDACRGVYSPQGLACAACGACAISGLVADAEDLGYRVIISEGTPAVVQAVIADEADAIFGVACLESLEKCFGRVFEMGIPYAGVPLLRNGCVETEAEVEVVREMLRVWAPGARPAAGGYGPLLRLARGLFQADELGRLLAADAPQAEAAEAAAGCDAFRRTEAIVLDWLTRAGKRFRPFITLAAYAAMREWRDGSPPAADDPHAFPDPVRRVAVAMEVFHKASLAHDDVEDDDPYRYGQPTIHARYGAPTAINTGDYLLGLGYRLVAGQARALGPDAASDVLARLSDAHIRLCRGQGAELLLTSGAAVDLRPADILAVYALKTAPAFSVAMYAGMRMAGPVGRDARLVAAFCRHLGVAYQVLDDLDDLRTVGADERSLGQDFLRRRPTILRAFALEAGAADDLDRLHRQAGDLGRLRAVECLRRLYGDCGAADKARTLVAKCRRRAIDVSAETEPPGLRRLMLFLLNMVLGAEGAESSGD